MSKHAAIEIAISAIIDISKEDAEKCAVLLGWFLSKNPEYDLTVLQQEQHGEKTVCLHKKTFH